MATENAERLSISLPAQLAARLDEMVDELRQDHPYENVNRSGLIAHLLSEHLALIDAPEHEIAGQPEPEPAT